MIDYISIKDFAIIDNIEVGFGPGLSIITGETGSGKSILVTAISLALGSRADSSFVRTGAEKAIIELSATIPNGESTEEEIVISREINTAGKNICKINGRIVTLSELQEKAMAIADIHGQYDNQTLLNPDNHIGLVDNFSGNEIFPLLESYKIVFEKYTYAKKALDDLISMETDNARKVDFYNFEIKEIDAASPVPGEDEDIKDKLSLLQNSEKIYAGLQSAYEEIAGSKGAYTSLGNAVGKLEQSSMYSQSINSLLEETNDIYYRIEDISSKLREVLERVTFDPEEIDNFFERLNTLDNLKKKYGGSDGSISSVLEYRDKIAKELALIENYDDEKLKFENNYNEAKDQLMEIGSRLSELRRKSADKMSSDIARELAELNFSESDILVKFEALSNPGENGLETAELLITTNVGEPHKPLAKIASGGEISRIMLAIKKITAAYDEVPTLIFDEIDQGISGKTAAIVGRKLKDISRDHQIICITHLPQIASRGDANYRIYKDSADRMTFTHIDKLKEEDTITEIARLLGGETITETAIENAKELLSK